MMREQHAQQPPVQRRASIEPAARQQPRRQGSGVAPASPHGVGHFAGLHSEDAPFQSSHLRRGSVPAVDEEEDEELYADDEPLTHVPRSARRYTQMPVAVQAQPRTVVRYQHHPVPPRSSRTTTQAPSWATTAKEEEERQSVPLERRRPRPHALFFVGLGVLVMLVGWQLLTLLGVWWQHTQDDWRYGYPRTYQTDVGVGHSGVSHFLAQNLHGHLYVEELPADDPTHAKMYIIPLSASGQQSDLLPLTVQVRDVNGDGKPYLIVLVGQERFIFINDHGAFRPLKPGEHVSL